MASVALTALGEPLMKGLGDAKVGLGHMVKQLSLGDIYGIKDDKARLRAFVNRVKSGQYAPTRVDESGRLID